MIGFNGGLIGKDRIEPDFLSRRPLVTQLRLGPEVRAQYSRQLQLEEPKA
jgi:hypothetical protein